ncbi:single-strand binding family protein [Cutibacterium modestum HL037PA2]|nr:single-strand binding family protein [Cutibacterium modestum HL037PA2]
MIANYENHCDLETDMAGETPITVIGNLTADPELRFTPNGVPVANFTVASTPRTFDRQTNEWRDGEAMFLNCSVWRQFAENVAESLSKGMRVVVSGNLRARSYEDRDGNRRTSYEIDVNEVGPSLRFASAKVSRNQSSGGGNWGGNAGGGQGGNWGGNSGNQGSYNNGDANRGGGVDPWASAQADEPPF